MEAGVMSDYWQLRTGEFTDRRRLSDEFGFPWQEGIAHSRRSSHMVLFARTGCIGLSTGWIGDRYHYAGASKHSLNNIVLKSFEQGQVLHIIEWSGSTVYRYLDSFILEDVDYKVFPRESGAGIELPVFRLVPVRHAIHVPHRFFDPASSGRAQVAPVQRHELIGGPPLSSVCFERLRPEARLEHRFCQYLIGQGHPVHRWRIYHTPGCAPLFNDITIPRYRLLVEAKANCDRKSIREAIGQLADYTRHVDHARHALLVPMRPEPDLIELVHSTNAALIWPTSDGRWATSAVYLAGLGLRIVSSADA
jgi:hypothetical protein